MSIRAMASLALLGLALTHNPARASNIVLNVIDGPSEGFNDPTTRTPVAGNPGTTLGQQRLNVFEAAASFWEDRLDSNVNIVVDARFDPQNCQQFSATLGAAGPLAVSRDFPGAPSPDTWYVSALANSIVGVDTSSSSDLIATFNSNLDLGSSACLNGQGWDYRIGVDTGSALELFATVKHELAHGLGFLTLYSLSSGAKFDGRDDAFLALLRDRSTNKQWSDMTNGERTASQVNTGNVVWTGARVTADSGFLVNGLQPEGVRMYAPNPVQGGSSISHWDTALQPNELMEPSSTTMSDEILTTGAFVDMGWQVTPPMIDSPEVDILVSCLAGSGRVDANIVNGQSASSLYRLELQNTSPRQTTVGFEDFGRITVTARPPGTYTAIVKRDGGTILSKSITIDCNAAQPTVSEREVTVLNACRAGNGFVQFQFVNPTSSSRPYVIQFEGVPGRSTTAAAFGWSQRGTSGRPDGTYAYTVRSGSSSIDSGQVTVDCD